MATYRIVHPGIYMRVNGKLQQLEMGHELTLKKKVGDKMVKRKFAEEIYKPKKKSKKKE